MLTPCAPETTGGPLPVLGHSKLNIPAVSCRHCTAQLEKTVWCVQKNYVICICLLFPRFYKPDEGPHLIQGGSAALLEGKSPLHCYMGAAALTQRAVKANFHIQKQKHQ